jgi:hypothetical protein
MEKDVRKLLAECATLINAHGPDSAEVQRFIDQHRDNPEFVELAQVSQTLKRAFLKEPMPTPEVPHSVGNRASAPDCRSTKSQKDGKDLSSRVE